ncbi:NAD(P)/FAD-dependent oxidoreductase [Luteolibacter sp. Populi]|uniref:NAD(P)/FAD-dependent oxidoreductase n=1 Tax=Luteolibacter sp. Populi TaxID=3230487 RepID=UPI003465F8FC
MDLSSDHAYWRVKSGIIANYPPLEAERACDVAILGAGITGSLIAEALSADGHHVIVLDGRDVATGSTSASTALLQYEIDVHLIDLIAQHGPDKARTAYRACYDAIDLLEERVARLGLEDCNFTRKDSVYLASRARDVPILQAEAEARRQAGIEVHEWSAGDVASHFSFQRPLALHSPQAAEVDAYRLAHGMLAEVRRRGGEVFDRTRVTAVEVDAAGVILQTDRKLKVRAKRVVAAMGYESECLFDTAGLVDLRSSFAIASEPLAEAPGWWRRCLLWETARPYFYLRGDGDGRAIIGGEDLPFRNPAARDRLVNRKGRILEKRFHEMFPAARMESAFAWAGTFGETADGLAYIGSYRKHPLCYFALGFGGNGIIYSVIAAEIIRSSLLGKQHPWALPFKFDR